MLLNVYQILFTMDFVLLPLFLLFWIGFFSFVRRVKYNNSIIKQYFLPALLVRFLGALLTALMYQYYYGYGDTFMYYIGVKDIFNMLLSNPQQGLEMILYHISDWDVGTQKHVTFKVFFYNDKEAIVLRTGAVFSLLGAGTYIGTSLAITAFSFVGCWCLYLVFYDLYPQLHRPFAYAILFLPSMCFWSTGLMKEPLVIAGLAFFVYGVYFIFIKFDGRVLMNIILILLGVVLMRSIKAYVLVSILPATFVWVFLMYREKIKNPTLKALSGPFFLVFGGIGALVVVQQLGSIFQQFTIDGILKEANDMQYWLSYSTKRDGGTGYSLGEFDPSLGGMLRLFPQAVNVALFRPYLWEARKIIVIPSAFEALFTLGFTIYVFFKVGIFNLVKYLFSAPTVTFCLLFSIVFAFAVGFTSMNFGALARYKIPCLPFYFSGLIILLHRATQKEAQPTVAAVDTPQKSKPRLV